MGSELPVLVGYFSDRVPDDDQTRAEVLSKFGGSPVWIDGEVPDEYPFMCCNCGSELGFVCQVATPYCEHKRCLYLFGCHEHPECSTSPRGWKVVRGVVESRVSKCEYASSSVEEKECDGSGIHQGETELLSDWLQAAFGSMTLNNQNSGIGLRQEKPKARQPMAVQSSVPAPISPKCESELLPPFFIQVEDEPPDNSCNDATGKRARELQLEYERRERDCSPEDPEGIEACNLEPEAYEESPDKVCLGHCMIFLKLQRRLARSPTQVIRYSFGGKPLFISPFSEENAAQVGHCPLCRSDRVFEMQLVPAAADEICKRRHRKKEEAAIEWGVVVVFTCKEDCIPAKKYTFEHAVVQEIL